MGNLDSFEQQIKQQLEQQEYTCDSAQWAAIEKQLPPPGKPVYLKSVAAGAAIIGIAVLAWYFIKSSNTPQLTQNSVHPTLPSNQVSPNGTIDSPEQPTSEVLDTPIEWTTDEIKEKPEIHQEVVQEVLEKSQPILIDEVEAIPSMELPLIDENQALQNEPATPVKRLAKPSAKFVINHREICAKGSIEFEAINEVEETDYLWNFGDGQHSTLKAPRHQFNQPGTYYVQLEVRHQKDKGIVAVSDRVAIDVAPNPTVEFSWETNEYDVVPSTQFINLSEGGTAYLWDLGNGITSTKQNASWTYRKEGMYNVSLEVVNASGCKTKTTKTLEISKDYNLLAPNTFTPNGDGINDVFIPEALKVMQVDFEMTIYDTRGLIYTTKNVSYPWDGTNQRNGTKCKQGNYVWVVTYVNEKGEKEQYKGAILVLE